MAFTPPPRGGCRQLQLSPLRQALGLLARKSLISRQLLIPAESAADRSSLPLETILKQLRQGQLDLLDYLDYFGSGPGLTPAFDDFCSGLLFATSRLQSQQIKNSEKLFAKLAGRTTLTSRWQLEFARHGQLNIAFEQLFENLLAGQAKLSECLAAARFGHSSGIDLLTGVLRAVEAISRPE